MLTYLYLLLLAATFFGLGCLCLWRVKFARPAEEFVFSSALGLAVLSYAMVLLGALGVMTLSVVCFVLVVCALIASPGGARFLLRIPWRVPRWELISAISLAVFVGAAVLNLILASNPILEVDTYEYHVTVPKAWLNDGGIFGIPYCLQSNYHFLADMINIVALSLSHNDMVLCKLFQWYAGLLLAVATWCFGRSFFSSRVAWVAATLTYMVKEIAWVSANGYVDLTVGLYVWLGIFALVRAAQLRGWTWHVLAGLFFGCGFAGKQSVAIFIALAYGAWALVLLLDSQRRSQLRRWPGRAVAAGVVALLVASPWMIKNYVITNDPFFPALIRAFAVPDEFAEPASGFTGFYGGLGRYLVWDHQTWPQLRRAFFSFRTNVMYSGANLLVVWLLIGILLLRTFRSRSSPALKLLIAIGLLAAPWFAWVTSRFLFGFFPVYLLVLMQTLRLVTGRRRIFFAALSLVLLFCYARTLVRYDFYGHPVARLEFTKGPIVSMPAREKFLARNNYAYPAIERINRTLTERGDRLLATDASQGMPWLDVRFIPNPHTLSKNVLLILWDRFGDSEAMAAWLKRHGITHVLLAEGTAEELESKSGFIRARLELVFGERGLMLYRLR